MIDLGGVTVRLVPEPVAHTAGDLWAVVEPDGIVLAGDLWCNDVEGYLGDGSVAGEVAAIDHLRDAGGVCLPGHGPPGAITPDDPMQRYARWILERTAAGMAAGLAGEELQRDVCAAFDGGAGRRSGSRSAWTPASWRRPWNPSRRRREPSGAARPAQDSASSRITERMTRPACMSSNAASTSSSPITLVTMKSRSSRPSR